MKKLFLFLPLALFLSISILLYRGLFLDPNRLPSALIGMPFPHFTLPSLDSPSDILSSADVKGGRLWSTYGRHGVSPAVKSILC